MDEKIRFSALENAIKFNGKANPGAIIGKVLSEDPSLKENMKEINQQIQTIVHEINEMGLEKQKEELLKINPNYFDEQKEAKEKRKEERQDLPPLKNAEVGKIITRIAPEPSKYNHFGHAINFMINFLYAKKYEGKCLLRFDDTNPEKEAQEYVDAMQEDVLDYLGIEVADTVFASDSIDELYSMAEQLISEGKAYTTTQPQEEMSAFRREEKDHPDREKSVEDVQSEWNQMKEGSYEGVLRLKISMQHKNAVMRDPVIFRVCTAEHFRHGHKYKAWPMYDFESAIMDGKMKVTHVMRSNEFESRIELHEYIRDQFGLPHPMVKQYARFNVVGATTQGREIREMIESGDYIGWDDPRLITLRALKRRGLLPQAYGELAKIMGMSKTTSDLDVSQIESISRSLLDSSAQRFFFINEVREIEIHNAPEKIVNLDLHPETKKGGRELKATWKLFMEDKDFHSIEQGEEVRFMDAYNARREGDSFQFVSHNYDEFNGKKIIHWLPIEGNHTVEITLNDNSVIKGICEETINHISHNDVIQFERFGFCRLDHIENDVYKFWLTHK